MPNSSPEERARRLADKNRIEAFSDGVFAIIITLLVLEIHRPDTTPGALLGELLKSWPSYLAYILAFLYVGIIWLNHHALFKSVAKVDLGLNWLNLAGLCMTALMPYPTGVLANAFRSGDFQDQRAAVVLYALVAGLMSTAWLPIFPYLNRHPELLKPEIKAETFARQINRPLVGMLCYTLAALLGWFFHPLLAIAGFVFMVGYHAWTSEGI